MKKTGLKAPIEDFLPYQIDYTANYSKSFRREFQMKYISSELSADEFGILHLIYDDPKISQTDIGKYLFKGKAHIGKMLNEMENKGYIKRVVDTRNNIMIKRNEMTEKGLETFKLASSKMVLIKEKMVKEFTDEEVSQFISYLKRFRKTLGSIVDVKLK